MKKRGVLATDALDVSRFARIEFFVLNLASITKPREIILFFIKNKVY